MVSEALLEMHYHRALVELFKEIHGASYLHMIKPTPQREKYLGFDQAWMPLEFDENDVIDLLDDPGELDRELIFLGYILQFKRPKVLVRSSSRKPPHYHTPYVRFELDLGSKSDTRLSQHELLVCLSRFCHAHVSYVCPMLFDKLDVFSEPDIQDLRFVEVSSAPLFNRGETHCITFQSDSDYLPYWMSEPRRSESFGVRDWSREYVVSGAENVLNLLWAFKEVHDNNEELAEILSVDPKVESVKFPEVRYRSVPQSGIVREPLEKTFKLKKWEERGICVTLR